MFVARRFNFYVIIALTFLLASLKSYAQLFYGDTAKPASLSDLLAKVGPGKVLIVSEQHDNESHHLNQKELLIELSRTQVPISVGMEFFSYPDQGKVDAYALETIDESQFLKDIGWGSLPFEFYKFQVLFPYYVSNGKTIALNLPRTISAKVSKGGIESLTHDEKALLPPQLVMGNEQYFERFVEAMDGHVPDTQALQNYFTAHCLWDETMAWRAIEYLRHHPKHLLMIIVGDFHVAYEDGLVARLRDQGIETVLVSQVTDLSEVAPHSKYGRRGDFVWLSP